MTQPEAAGSLPAGGLGLEGPGVQDVDRPARVEALPQPARARRSRVQVEAHRLVSPSERPNGIAGNRGRRWDSRHSSSVRSPEPQLTIEESLDLEALLVDGAMMAPAEHREVRERGGAALSPVADVMPLAER